MNSELPIVCNNAEHKWTLSKCCSDTTSAATLLHTVWGGNLFRRFCNTFSESSLCLLGQHGSCSTAERPVELSINISQNLQNKLLPQTVLHQQIKDTLSASDAIVDGLSVTFGNIFLETLNLSATFIGSTRKVMDDSRSYFSSLPKRDTPLATPR